MNLCRTAIAGSVLAGIVLFLGCRLHREFPPQPVKVVGTSYHLGEMQQAIGLPETPFANLLTASGDSDAPVLALDPLQGRLVAKQMAKQIARRELARKVAALEVRPGRTVGDFLRSDPDKRKKVEDWIRQAQQKGLIKSGGNKYSVLLTLDLRPLDKILDLPGGLTGTIAATTATRMLREEFRKRAEAEAIGNARIRALEYVKGLRLEGNETVGEQMLRNDSLDRAVREKTALLKPITVTFRENGTCEAVLVLDVAEIQRIAEEHRGGWRLPTLLRWPIRKSRT